MAELSEREKFIILVSNDKLKVSDSIVLLEGDGFHRVKKVRTLFQEKWAPSIVISGGIIDYSHGSIHSRDLYPLLVSNDIPASSVIIEEKSQNTREQALEVLNIAETHSWTRIILVASHYHQFRAYLTFLKVLLERELKIEIISAPANEMDWFSQEDWGRRYELLEIEFEKIEQYKKLGHIADYSEAIDYQLWKEKQI